MGKKLTQEQWIEDANIIHGGKYDYSKVKYVNKRTEVIIICPIHGEFKQLAHNHRRGEGCPKCANENNKNNKQNDYESFIKSSFERFGEEYEFPNIEEEYINSHSIITIKHKKCGNMFKKIACDHITSKYGGCECYRTIIYNEEKEKKRYEDFVKRAKEKHGDKYDYSKVDLSNRDEKGRVCIICPMHGEFWKKPSKFLYGQGCQECSKINSIKKHKETLKNKDYTKNIEKRKNRFIKEFNELNLMLNNQFTVDFNTFIDYSTPIDFKCNKCGGITNRKPTVFLKRNCTCKHCNDRPRNFTYTTDEWILKAKSIHGDKYDYSKVDYKGSDVSVTLICHELDEFGEEHGEFKVTPHSHTGLMKSGCPKCSKKYGSGERFIKLAKLRYNSYYDYSKVEYKNALTEVIIICPKHGEFKMTPNQHLLGRGCPKCNESGIELFIRSFLEENEIEYDYQKKFKWLGNLSLDFYLPKYNIAIECQGEQHFKPIDFFGGEEKFKRQVERDKIKNNMCLEHGITILYYAEKIYECDYELLTNPKQILDKIMK